MKLFTAAALGLLMLGNANAYNITVDFEDSPLDGDGTQGSEPIVSRGFEFSGLLNKGVTNWPIGTQDDSKALHWCPVLGFCDPNDDVSITMTQAGSVAFDLLSLEVAGQTQDFDMQLTGYFVGGGTIQTTVLVSSQTLTPFDLGSSWVNLESLNINPLGVNLDPAVAVDNIAVVSSVPIPAAAWLFGSGLGLLGWFRRRQTA